MFPRGRSTAVLLVEDDAATRELYRMAFREAGYEVIAVEDGLSALRHVEASRPDAIVLDMALPRLGGRDVLREVRANPVTRHIPVVIVTGTDVSALNERAGVPVLLKPVQPEVVVRTVETLVRRASL